MLMKIASVSLFWNKTAVAILTRPWALFFAPVVAVAPVFQRECFDERPWDVLAYPGFVLVMILLHVSLESIRSDVLHIGFQRSGGRSLVNEHCAARTVGPGRDVSLLRAGHHQGKVEVVVKVTEEGVVVAVREDIVSTPGDVSLAGGVSAAVGMPCGLFGG